MNFNMERKICNLFCKQKNILCIPENKDFWKLFHFFIFFHFVYRIEYKMYTFSSLFFSLEKLSFNSNNSISSFYIHFISQLFDRMFSSFSSERISFRLRIVSPGGKGGWRSGKWMTEWKETNLSRTWSFVFFTGDSPLWFRK